MKANFYIDGFNLYYSSLRNTQWKWLDLSLLCKYLLARHTVGTIKYFTARVSSRPYDPNQPVRQETYLRALRTIPNLEIVYGSYLSNPVFMPLVTPAAGKTVAHVIKTEEKGSDVNLATHLLVDGFKHRYEIGILITNDSDLVEPVKVVRRELGLPVGLFNPCLNNPSYELRAAASFFRPVRKGVLAASQFPAILTDRIGTFSKPQSW